MKLQHLNIRALMCSLPLFQHFFHTFKQTDIFAVTETHIDSTAWKRPKYGAFSSQYFPASRLNMGRYWVCLRIQVECGKIRTRKNSIFGPFLRSLRVYLMQAFMRSQNMICENRCICENWIKLEKKDKRWTWTYRMYMTQHFCQTHKVFSYHVLL